MGQEISPALGYVTGWSMVMDYILNPLICIRWCSEQASNFAPEVRPWMWAIVIFFLFTGLNLRGVKTSARVNALLATAMGLVVLAFFVAAARYIFGNPHDGFAFFTRPLYDPATFDIRAVMGGTSIAVLTYIGFDGISTLSEEVENPRRNILLATVLTCLVIGILSALECYAAQLVWPASQPFPNSDTAFVDVAKRAAVPLGWIVGLTLIVANFGSGMAAQFGAARLLFGMGRSNALPAKFFGAVEAKRGIPQNNVIFVGVIALIGAFLIPYGLGSGDVELRRADRVHGSQPFGDHALLRACARKEVDQPDSAAALDFWCACCCGLTSAGPHKSWARRGCWWGSFSERGRRADSRAI